MITALQARNVRISLGAQDVLKGIDLDIHAGRSVTIVGPNGAGKSTLLSSISAAKPEIGDYPFTTLVPNLGVVKYHDFQSFVMADIPGIIEGASEGKGLGVRFLRHIERNANLLFLISSNEEKPMVVYKTLVKELQAFNPELLDKSRILGFSKSDLIDEKTKQKIIKKIPEGIPYVFFSSITQSGLNELKDILWENINKTEDDL
jgi:GTP-binding protein